MNAALTSAFAALGGSFIGAMAPVLSSYVIQRSQTRRDLITHQVTQRESLYSKFIKDAARLHAKSLTESVHDLDQMVALYALVSRLRLIGSDAVVVAAEHVVAAILRQFGQDNLTIEQIGREAKSANINPLGDFSAACRLEFQAIFEEKLKLAHWARHGAKS